MITTQKRKLIQSAGVVSGLTLLSRILGMIRDIMSAGLFGTSRVWDAFVLAFTLPNFLRRLLSEGAFTGAFVPLFTEILRTRGKEEAERFAHAVGTALLAALAVLAILFYGVFVWLRAVGILSGNWMMMFDFLAVLFPYIFFLGLAAINLGVLYSEKRFWIPAVSSMILNVFWILGVLLVCPMFSGDRITQAKILSVVIVLSGLAQFLIQWLALRAHGYRLKWLWDFGSVTVKRLGVLVLPALFGAAVLQINIFVDLIFGYFLPAGASSSLWYGSRLMEFPLGIFALSLGTVLLPEYSHQAADKNYSLISKTLAFSLRSVFLVVVPASAGLMVLGRPIVQILFERGEFTPLSTLQTGGVLAAYSLGLFAYAGLYGVVSAFFGIQNMKTPVKVGAFAILLHLILNAVLVTAFKETGLAFSTAFSGISQFLILLVLFRSKIGDFGVWPLGIFFLKLIGVSLIMGWGVAGFYSRWSYFPFESGLANQLLSLLVSIGAGVLVYVGLCVFVRIREMGRMFEWILGKK